VSKRKQKSQSLAPQQDNQAGMIRTGEAVEFEPTLKLPEEVTLTREQERGDR